MTATVDKCVLEACKHSPKHQSQLLHALAALKRPSVARAAALMNKWCKTLSIGDFPNPYPVQTPDNFLWNAVFSGQTPLTGLPAAHYATESVEEDPAGPDDPEDWEIEDDEDGRQLDEEIAKSVKTDDEDPDFKEVEEDSDPISGGGQATEGVSVLGGPSEPATADVEGSGDPGPEPIEKVLDEIRAETESTPADKGADAHQGQGDGVDAALDDIEDRADVAKSKVD